MKKSSCLLGTVLIFYLVFLLAECNSSDSYADGSSQGEAAEMAVELLTVSGEQSMTEPEIPELHCPECGWVVTEEAFYCSHCGIKLRDDGKAEPWHTLTSIDELKGTWLCESGIRLCYPDYSLGTGSAMVSVEWPEEDHTERWQEWAEKEGYTMEQLWQKRNSWTSRIYGPVISDENGTQEGMVCRRGSNGEISAHMMLFLPEKIIRDNAAFFEISPDGERISTKGEFHFYSRLTFSMTGNGEIYERQEDGDE